MLKRLTRQLLRAGLRETLRRSPLCDARACARALEHLYRGIWCEWCVNGTVEPQIPGSPD